jgi:hypothetical protein
MNQGQTMSGPVSGASAATPASNAAARPPEPHDATGVGAGLGGYARTAPTAPHLGWTEPQVNARTGGAGRPLGEVLKAVESYQVPQRGLNGIPQELFSDSKARIQQYLGPLQGLEQRFQVSNPAQLNNPQAWRDAARGASDYRNQLMESTRQAISEKGLGASQAAKATAPPFETVLAKTEQGMLKANPQAFEGLSASQRSIAISQQVIKNAAKADPTFNALVHGANDASRGLQALKLGGRALMVVGAVVDGASIVSEARKSQQTGDWSNTERQTAKVAGGWLGAAAAGAAVGAASGTIVPGLGNVAGFVIGAVAGGVGYWLGSQGGEAAYNALAAH